MGDARFNKSGLSSRISRNRNELNTEIQIFDYVRLRLPQIIHPHSNHLLPGIQSIFVAYLGQSIMHRLRLNIHIIRLELHRINIDLM